MRKTLLILLAGAMLAISSCSKQGPVGPTGPQGPTGASGATGANASTAYELQGVVQPNNWNSVGTSGTAGALVYAQMNSPYLSFDSVGTGAVLVYKLGITNLGVRSYDALPWVHYNGSGTQFTEQYNWNDGALVVDVYNSLYTFTTYSNADTFNIIVIPGSKSLPQNVNRSDYNSIIAHYHPRKVN